MRHEKCSYDGATFVNPGKDLMWWFCNKCGRGGQLKSTGLARVEGFNLRGRIAKAIEEWHNDPNQFSWGSAADRVLEVLSEPLIGTTDAETSREMSDDEAAAEDATWD